MLALLVLGLAVTTALPQHSEKINWPDRPSWWPEKLNWPPTKPTEWPAQPSWWPDRLPWPPVKPQDQAIASVMIELTNGINWPDQPDWWPASLPWPPAIPEEWPDQPDWWPDSLPWPPAIPEEWPDQPDWWPDSQPWPPAIPEEWPDQPDWWPESLPWPPAIPEQWPDQPSWWPDSLPWPPSLADINWPEIQWPPQIPDWVPVDQIPYIPSRDNQYHLFTRANPSVSQPLVLGANELLAGTNYSPDRKTVVLVHGLQGSAVDVSNAILVPALLAGGDVNVLVVDWSAGANSGPLLSTFFSALSGNHVARFLNWLSETSGGDLANYHLVGVGLGAWNVGFIGRRLRARVGYITALDPSRGPAATAILPPLNPTVAVYTEVIHTTAGTTGYAQPIGDVDFYPNGGMAMPGCGANSECSRTRAVYYFAESVQSGGFTGVECESHRDALNNSCDGEGRLNMGGLTAKAGSRGVYHLETNALPPFSKG